MPPFESETKRSTSSAGGKGAIKTTLPIVESGTSVAPRQRPKPSAQAGPPGHLPIGLPPSPSPRNTISSPIPSSETPQTNQQAPQQILHQTQINQNEQPNIGYAVTTPEPFIAQFNANFPPVPAPVTTTLTTSIVPVQQQHSLIQQQSTVVAKDDNEKSNTLDSLFQSNYPDPFRESTEPTVQPDNLNLFNNPDPNPLHQSDSPLETTGSNSFIAQALCGTPTKTTQLLVQQKGGHRRNMSDTSAFNK